MGDWATAHPGQTIAECVTSQENELAKHAGQIAKLETDKADKSEIPDVTGYVPTSTYNPEQAAQNRQIAQKETAETFTAPSHIGAIGTYIPLSRGGPAIIFRYSGLADVDPSKEGPLPDTGRIQFFKPDGTPLTDSIKTITSFHRNRDMYIRADLGNNELTDAKPYYIVVI